MGRTKNYSIRFDEDKFGFFIEKNPTINKPQEIVDYFLDNYWLESKLKEREREVEQRLSSPAASTFIPPNQHIEDKLLPIDKMGIYRKEISTAENYKQLLGIIARVKKDSEIIWRQRLELEGFAEQIRQQKGFIFND